MRRENGYWRGLLGGLLLPLAAAAVLIVFSTALGRLDGGRNAEDQRQLEEALRRSCVACYAAEGSYPESLAYLEEHYGLQVDKERYTVVYSVFAQNLMPDITVLVNQP